MSDSGVRVVKLTVLSFMNGQLQVTDQNDRPVFNALNGDFVSVDLESFLILVDRLNTLTAAVKNLTNAV